MQHDLFDFVVVDMRTVMHYFFLIEAIRCTILIFIAILLPCILTTQKKIYFILQRSVSKT